MKRVLIAVAIVLTSLVAAVPADAATVIVTESGVRIIHTNSNDLIVRGTSERDDLFLHEGMAPGEVSVFVGDDGPDGFVVSVPVRNVTYLGLGGDDQMAIQPRPENGVDIPGNVTFNGGQGYDILTVRDATVAGRVVLNHGQDDGVAQVYSAMIGRDLNVRGGNDVFLDGVVVERRLDIRTGAGRSSTEVDRTIVGGFMYRGAGDSDAVRINRSELGWAPRFLTGNDSDQVNVTRTTWTGKARVSTGNGNDIFFLAGSEEGPPPNPLDLSANLGRGDDRAIAVLISLTPNSAANGGPGDDTFEGDPEALVLRSFETITEVGP